MANYQDLNLKENITGGLKRKKFLKYLFPLGFYEISFKGLWTLQRWNNWRRNVLCFGYSEFTNVIFFQFWRTNEINLKDQRYDICVWEINFNHILRLTSLWVLVFIQVYIDALILCKSNFLLVNLLKKFNKIVQKWRKPTYFSLNASNSLNERPHLTFSTYVEWTSVQFSGYNILTPIYSYICIWSQEIFTQANESTEA